MPTSDNRRQAWNHRVGGLSKAARGRNIDFREPAGCAQAASSRILRYSRTDRRSWRRPPGQLHQGRQQSSECLRCPTGGTASELNPNQRRCLTRHFGPGPRMQCASGRWLSRTSRIRLRASAAKSATDSADLRAKAVTGAGDRTVREHQYPAAGSQGLPLLQGWLAKAPTRGSRLQIPFPTLRVAMLASPIAAYAPCARAVHPDAAAGVGAPPFSTSSFG
jgi:hypothetical protein